MDDFRQQVLSVQEAANLLYRALFPEGINNSQSHFNVGYNPDDGLLDPFGRLRISPPKTLWDGKQLVDNQPLFWSDANLFGTGTTSIYQTGTASTLIGVTANTAGARVRETKRRFNYQPGKGILVSITGVLNPDNVLTGTLFQIGYNDEANGLFFQLSGTQFSVGIRSSTSGTPVDTIYNQQTWNVDKMDGTGKSGINIDLTKSQIFLIDFQWLGVGKVRWGFEIDGSAYYCHGVSFSNSDNKVYMGNPNLRIRYYIRNYGNGPTATLRTICSSVISEGGAEDTGFALATDRGSTGLATNNNAARYPLIAIRLNPNYLSAFVRLSRLSVICDTSSSFKWEILLNPIVSGTAFTFTDVPNSAVQKDVSRTNTTTVYPGTKIASGYELRNTSNSLADLPELLTLGSDSFNNPDVLVLAVQRLSAQAETFYGGLGWKETI